jgi:hypothetical protein
VGCEVVVTEVYVTQYLVKMCVLIIVYFVEESVSQLFGPGFQKFSKKSSKNLKILGARTVTCSKFRAEDRQILHLKVQNVVATVICHLEFL